MANNSNNLRRYNSSSKLFCSHSKKAHLSSGKSIILSGLLTAVVILISFSSNLILTVQSQSLSGDNGKDGEGNDYLLDERFPTVISNLYPNGEKDSLFGAAVSLMNYSQDYTWILIGEPKGNLSGNSGVNEPGVIWRCELGFGSERRRAGGWSEYCKIIEGDNSIRNPNTNNPVQATENSWFGGSMSVIESSAKTGAETSSQLIACSHRRGLSKAMPMSGACYFFKADGLNRRKTNSRTPKNFKLNVVSILTPSDDEFTILDTTTNTTHTGYKYAHAAFGMSLNVKGDHIFVGRPGPSRNRDNIFSSSIATYDVGKLLGTGTGTATETGTGNGTGPTVGLEITQAEQKPYYYGYAVTSGNYYNSSSATSDQQTPTHFVSGSPRENYVKGAVRISATKGLDLESNINNNSSEPIYQEIISGFHIGSYFGSVLYSQDIDGDGRDELFIGAPNTGKLLSRFFSKQFHPFLIEESTVNPSEDDDKDIDPYFTTNPYYDGDRGCVYIYQSKDGKLEVIQILIGSNEAFSRFGSSISSIEHPKITEGISKKYILIGAPYENGYTGAIYFYDTQTLIKSRTFSKRISASQLNSIIPSTPPSKPFQGFGASFSNSVDVDGNKTPDLLVGSHLSKNVILFRTRHQIEITKQTMRISTGNIEIKLEDFPKSELDKTTQLFILSVDVEYILLNTPQGSDNKRENIQFWNRLQIDTAETKGRYTVAMQHHSERAVSNLTRIDNQTLEFSYLSLRQSSSSDANAITETINIKTDFYVTLNENYADTEAPRGIEMKLQTWCDETKILEQSRMDYGIIQEQGINMDPILNKSQQTDMFRPFLPAPTYSDVLTAKIPLRQAVCRKPQCVPVLSISNVHFATIDGARSETLEGNRFIIGSASNIVLKWTMENADTVAESEPALFPGAFIKYGRQGEDHRSRNRGRNNEEGNDMGLPDAINLTNWSLLSKDNSHCHSHNVPLLSPQEFWLSCNHSGVLPTNRTLTMQVKLNMTGIFPGRTEQKLHFTIILTHNHSNSDPTEELGDETVSAVTVELTLLAEAMVSIVGVSRISTRNMRDAEKGTVVNHNYLVSLTGESPVNRISLEFFVPVMRESDAANRTLVNTYHPTLTTLTNNPNQNQGNKGMESEFECKIDTPRTSALMSATTSKVLGSGTESSPSPSDVDVNGSGRRIPLPGVGSGSGSTRGLKDPSTTNPTGSFIFSDEPENVLEFDGNNNPESTRTIEPLKYDKNSTLLLSCSYPISGSGSTSSSGGVSKPKSSVTCLHIKCNILKVNKGAQFRILFSLRLSSDDEPIQFLSADPSRNEILIQSTGMATILSRIPSENHTSLATSQNKIKMMEVQVVVHEKEPIWIYVVAVIGAIIFLLALVFGLYKCGFFKRDMKVQMDSAQGMHGAVVYNNTATDDKDETQRIRIQNLEDSPQPQRAIEASRFLS